MKKLLVGLAALISMVLVAEAVSVEPPFYWNSFQVIGGAAPSWTGMRAYDRKIVNGKYQYFTGTWSFPSDCFAGTGGVSKYRWVIKTYDFAVNAAGTGKSIVDSTVIKSPGAIAISEFGACDSVCVKYFTSATCTTRVFVDGDANSGCGRFGRQ